MFSKTYGKNIMFPVAIGELSISADVLKLPGEKLAFATSIVPGGSSAVGMNLFAFQSEGSTDSRLCIHVSNGEIRGTADNQASSANKYADVCYELKWGTDVSLCKALLKTDDPKSVISAEAKLNILNTTAFRLIDTCLGQVVQSDVKNQHSRYFAWMQDLRDSKRVDGTQLNIDDSIQRSQSTGIEEDVLLCIGAHLKSIVTGQCDPLALLLEDDLLTRFYAQEASSSICYSYLVDYIKLLAFKEPGIKILEVGAGTGGATWPLLRAVCSDGDTPVRQYDFTDVSSGFFEKAQVKLHDWNDILQFKTLNIGKDPVSHDYERNSYDVVLAYNSMHASGSIDDALKNTRDLLKADGESILIEITQLFPWVDAIFGLLPGWYSGMVVFFGKT